MSAERRPVRLLEWREAPDGRVEVLRPKFGTGRLGRWISARLARPHLAIRLDDTGSFVWRLCDGEQTVAGIAERLRAHEKRGTTDVDSRLATFLERMALRGMIRM